MYLTRYRRPLLSDLNWFNNEFARMGRELDSAFGAPASSNNLTWDVQDDVVTVSAELPGINPENIDINVENRILSISGSRAAVETDENDSFLRRERVFGTFSRKLRLPFTIDADHVDANYENGILTITLPRVEAEKPRKIAVKTLG